MRASSLPKRVLVVVALLGCRGELVGDADPTQVDANGIDEALVDTSTLDTEAPDTFVRDTFVPVVDTFVIDTFVPDTFVPDTLVPDTFVPDTLVPDTFVPDTFVPDTFVADTFVADTFVADTFVPDTIVPDTAVVDAIDETDVSEVAPPGVVEIAAGATHTCARRSDGAVYCWGDNTRGQIGDGTITPRPLPTAVLVSAGGAAFTNAIAIAAGGAHTCAVAKSDGSVFCWGYDNNGQIGDGAPGGSQLSPAKVTLPGGGALLGVAEVRAGFDHTCARKSDGTVFCWGRNDTGQVGDGTTTAAYAVATSVRVASGGAALSDVVAISAGGYHTCARKSDGTVVCWGRNDAGQIGDGTATTPRPSPTPVLVAAGGAALADVGDVAAGFTHTCVRKSDGTSLCWGRNATGQIGDDSTVNPRLSPSLTLVPGFAVASVAAGGFHSCARKVAGTVYCSGHHDYAQCGDGTTASMRKAPVAVLVSVGGAALSGVSAVSAGRDHNCALTIEGNVLCWGRNDTGQIGNGGMLSPVLSPTLVRVP